MLKMKGEHEPITYFYPDYQVTLYLWLSQLDLELLLNWGQCLSLKYSQCFTILKQHFLVYKIGVRFSCMVAFMLSSLMPYCLGIRSACSKIQKLALSLSVSFPNYIYTQWYFSFHSHFILLTAILNP